MGRKKEDVSKFIGTCRFCIEEQHETTLKNPIIIQYKRLLERFICDLWQIPKNMREYFSGHKWSSQYVLMCVDHFSKYTWGALINNKEVQTI